MATFTKFLKSFNPDSNTKGKQFEQFVKWFLKNDPEWSTQVDKIWLWNNYPKRWGRDCGIDLVFTHKNGDVWAVQAKCYKPDNTISKPDIDKFLNESDRRGINKRLLIATTDKINSNAKQVCDSKEERPVTRYLFSDFDKSAIEYPSHISKLKTAKRKKKPSPRKHQLKAIDAVAQGFKKNDRGQLIMACGTGKTFTTLWVKERISAKSTLVLLPSLSLLSQTLREWTFAATKPFDTLCVCSDQSVGKRSDEDEVIPSVTEFPFPVTWVTKDISTFLKGKGRKVIFSTYQSSPLIEKSQRKRGVPTFDLVIADEAHRCAGKIGTEFTTVLDEKKIRAKKRLFTTATPRTYSVSLKKSASEKGVEITDMSDEQVFGKSFYELKFGEAIELGLLTDYQVIIVGVDNPMIGEWIESRKLVTTNSGDITDAESLASQIGLIKAIKKYDLQRVISFHSRVKRAKEFSSNLQDAIDIVPKRHRPKGSIWTDFVSGQMTAYERRLKLGQLKELSDGDRGLLSNAKCLSEGVDVPSLDGVAFIDPKSSPTDIVQAVGRAIRLSKEKKVGTIVLPVFIKEGENAEASIEASNFKPIWNVLNALKAHDDVFSFELDQLRTNLGKKKPLGGSGKGLSKILFDVPEKVDQSFSDTLKTYLVEKTTSSWNFWFGLLESYVESKGDSIVPVRFITVDGFNLGKWVSHQRNYKINMTLSNERIGRLESLPKWSWDPLEDDWNEGYANLLAFVDEEDHSRVPTNFESNTGFNLYRWIGRQRSNYKNHDLKPDKVTQLEKLPKWSWDPLEDDWNEGYANLLAFVDEEDHSRVPARFKTEDGFNLGTWVSTQRGNVENLTPENRIKLEKLTKWSWDPLEDNWNEGYSNLLKFVEQEDHARVADGFKNEDEFPLGEWISRQRRKRDKLNQDQIQKLESLPKWSWDPLEDNWNEGYSNLLKFVEQEGHARVSIRCKAEDGSTLGKWVSNRRQNKKNNQLDQDQIQKLESLPKWSWDPLEDEWNEGFSNLLQFVEQKGHSRVPSRFITENGYNLGTWVSERRKSMKRGKIDSDRLKILEKFPKWSWDPFADDWEKRFLQLVKFVEQNDHSRVPARFKTEDGFSLGQWVYHQMWKKNKLTPEQVKKLESIKGWIWEAKK